MDTNTPTTPAKPAPIGCLVVLGIILTLLFVSCANSAIGGPTSTPTTPPAVTVPAPAPVAPPAPVTIPTVPAPAPVVDTPRHARKEQRYLDALAEHGVVGTDDAMLNVGHLGAAVATFCPSRIHQDETLGLG